MNIFLEKYGPYVCVSVTLVVLFIMWVFLGEYTAGKSYFEEVCFDNSSDIIISEKIPEYQPLESSPLESQALESQPVESSDEIQIPISGLKGKIVSKGERISVQTMENIYGLPFPSAWPNWLKNPESGENLELDGYNESLKLAIEYNGEQHYTWPNGLLQSKEEFIKQTRRDAYKVKMCEQMGVYLIIVPYTIEHKNIPDFIISKLPETIRGRVIDDLELNRSLLAII